MKRQKSALFDLGLVAVILYLIVHTISGRHGLLGHIGLQDKERALRQELAQVAARRQALELEVSRLSAKSLDLDYVEERARRVLHFARRDEVLIPAAVW